MDTFDHKKIEMELMSFTAQNFERPSDCRNLDQIRYYSRELGLKIQDLERKFNYVPTWAYALLAQYNAKQNSMMQVEIKNSYYR